MKNITLILAVALMASIFASCSSDKKEYSQCVNLIKKNAHVLPPAFVKLEKPDTMKIPVGDENFEKLAHFIEKNGFVVKQNGITSDHQYTFFDSDSTRHAMITVRRDKSGQPSIKDSVSLITVYAHYKGVKKGRTYYGYNIMPEKVVPTSWAEPENVQKQNQVIRKGYKEFLALVDKK